MRKKFYLTITALILTFASTSQAAKKGMKDIIVSIPEISELKSVEVNQRGAIYAIPVTGERMLCGETSSSNLNAHQGKPAERLCEGRINGVSINN